MKAITHILRHEILPILLIGSVFLLNACTNPKYPVHAVPDTDSSNIGPNGPEPLSGWNVKRIEHAIGSYNYHNTGGTWYITLEDSSFLDAVAIQLYWNPNPDDPSKMWSLFKGYRVSDRFIYIEDPARTYWGWSYVIFVYLYR